MKLLPCVCFLIVTTCGTGCGTGINIWRAIDREDLNAITRYVEKGGDLNAGATIYAKTPLLYAYRNAKKSSYDKLLELGADPNVFCLGGTTVMHYVAADSDSHWLQKALDHKGDPNLVNTHAGHANEGSVLWFAISSGKLDNIKLLLKSGADIDAYVHNSMTPFAYACYMANFDVALFLLKSGADPLKPAGFNNTAIYKVRERISCAKAVPPPYPPANLKNLDEIVRLLKERGLDPEKMKWDGSNWKMP